MLQQCDPGAIGWIERAFGDCIYNGRDLLGFCCGMASICCWLVAQIPQLYRNYKSKSVEALSPWFLAEWLLGDTFNLLGALLKGDQLPTVVFTAQYFICVDAVMMVQFLYYQSLQRRRERLLAVRRHRHHRHHRSRHHAQQQQQQQHGHSSGDEQEAQGSEREGWGALAAVPPAKGLAGAGTAANLSAVSNLAVCDPGSSGRTEPVVAGVGGRDVAFRPQRVLACLGTLLVLARTQQQQQQQQQQLSAHPLHRRLLMASESLGGSGLSLAVHMPHWAYTAGTTLGYCSSALYLTSRLSQIWKNYKRGSAEGLAISMFVTAICANTFYGSSILIRSYTWPELRSSLPWLIGSLGTVVLDGAIFMQWRTLGQGSSAVKDHPSDEESPLLEPDV